MKSNKAPIIIVPRGTMIKNIQFRRTSAAK